MDTNIQEKVIQGHKNGFAAMIIISILYALGIVAVIFGGIGLDDGASAGDIALFVAGIIWVSFGWIPYLGLKVLKPGEALVLTLFGKYIGTLNSDGFFYVNPFCTAVNPAADTKLGQSGDISDNGKSKIAAALTISGTGAAIDTSARNKKISLKVMTLSNSRQKVNDILGNPVEIAVAVMWKVTDTAKAVFAVDNYKEYLSLQCDTAVRNVVKLYPYDVTENIDTTGDGQADDGSLRGSTEVVANRIMAEIQGKVAEAGIEIVDARITYLAYAPEIAAAMLQRQQAAAVVDARKLIVDGAVGMVELALERLSEKELVDLDEERKAAMVSNLLVVLCGNHDAQPIVNTGSLY
ncbi:SPFH domain / Band 7 family protein [Butyrivibrio fibrisolvens DSM 3071]|uniref:SPFH domain / Band 7 family protein n=1 Tax=Butyrivibrio fibrisolvens DSM 3071 TaxID=1121131 RepID=A0A1M5PLI6_BUTFI|nr:SPFH domain-containing protein [Butyrivibrio fibrisolvens]SHH02590.1 SPFH domain / Band 7 family protein [Butyrivibrio fibrisolvens DSM 3071]